MILQLGTFEKKNWKKEMKKKGYIIFEKSVLDRILTVVDRIPRYRRSAYINFGYNIKSRIIFCLLPEVFRFFKME